jgi:hypothetical protein
MLAGLVGVSIGVNAIHAHQVEAAPAYLISEAEAIDTAGVQK